MAKRVGLLPTESIPVIAEVSHSRGRGWWRGRGSRPSALGCFRWIGSLSPQVLCEFKDIRSRARREAKPEGKHAQPVEQCLNYVRGARRGLFGNEPVQPWWGLVTDMNEFRLYWWDRAPAEYLRFLSGATRSLQADTTS